MQGARLASIRGIRRVVCRIGHEALLCRKDRFGSGLFVFGNSMRMISKVATLPADAIIFDLEDAVPIPDKTTARIIVRDTGQGFDEKGLQHLFLPFFTTKENGSGLGLATVKRIIDRLDGKISGANHPGGGAEITILLPLHGLSSVPQGMKDLNFEICL